MLFNIRTPTHSVSVGDGSERVKSTDCCACRVLQGAMSAGIECAWWLSGVTESTKHALKSHQTYQVSIRKQLTPVWVAIVTLHTHKQKHIALTTETRVFPLVSGWSKLVSHHTPINLLLNSRLQQGAKGGWTQGSIDQRCLLMLLQCCLTEPHQTQWHSSKCEWWILLANLQWLCMARRKRLEGNPSQRLSRSLVQIPRTQAKPGPPQTVLGGELWHRHQIPVACLGLSLAVTQAADCGVTGL